MLAQLFLLAARLTLADALSRAEAHNPDLVAQRLNLRVAEAGIEAAGQLPNPTVAGSVGPDEPTVFGSIDLKLPLFGQRGTAVAAAERERSVAEIETLTRAVRVRAEVRRAYFAVAAAQAQVALTEDAARLAVQLAALAEQKFKLGAAPRLEVEQASLLQKRAAQDTLDRQAQLTDARQVLATLLGEGPGGEELSADEPILPVPEAPALADLLARVGRHPEVQLAQSQRDAALARAQRERASVRPLPDVSVAFQRNLNGDGRPYLGLRYGLAFDLPVLSWNGGRVHQETAQASVAEAQGQAALLRLTGEVRAARSRWAAAASRARFYADEFLPAAQRLFEMARQGYELGRAPLFAVLQAQGEVSQARSRSVDAGQEAQRAYADLEEAVGGL